MDYFFCTSMPNSSSVLGSLSHMLKVYENLKSAIVSWSVVILNAVIGDPSAVFSCINVACIAVLQLLSMVWYVEYLTRKMTASESMRALYCFPTCTTIVGQSLMSVNVTWLVDGGPPYSWESLLAEGSISLKTPILLLSQWNDHLNCSNPIEVLLFGPSCSFLDETFGFHIWNMILSCVIPFGETCTLISGRMVMSLSTVVLTVVAWWTVMCSAAVSKAAV